MKNKYTTVKHEKTIDTSEPKTRKVKLWSRPPILDCFEELLLQ